MEQSTLTKYVELERQIKQLEEQKKMLRDSIQADLEADGAKTVKTDLATFSIAERKKWEYSDAVSQKEAETKMVGKDIMEEIKTAKAELERVREPYFEELSNLREQEEKNGTATCEVSKSLRVQLAK